MSIDFDVLINTNELAVDMKTGLETLQGISDATRRIGETLVSGQVPIRLNPKSNVRTTLKKNFKGSYGQAFSVEILDPKFLTEYKKIGKNCFIELVSYFLNEALYLDTEDLSLKSQKIVSALEEKADELIEQIRTSTLENIHEVSAKFNHEVILRNRTQVVENRKILAKFNRETARVLDTSISEEKTEIEACITRFNIYTGNGRLRLKEAEKTVAFGFNTPYKDVRLEAKKVFSENLDQNNGAESDSTSYLRLIAYPMTTNAQKIIKYIVTGFYE
jgi:hypothetical protein